jgi:hypothetical protein
MGDDPIVQNALYYSSVISLDEKLLLFVGGAAVILALAAWAFLRVFDMRSPGLPPGA